MSDVGKELTPASPSHPPGGRVSCAGRERPRTLGTMARKKITIRPPGLKPTTKVGTLGPYRGRLGFAWVIAPIVVGLVILIAGYVALFR